MRLLAAVIAAALVSAPLDAGSPLPGQPGPAGQALAQASPLTHGPFLGAVGDRGIRVWARSIVGRWLQAEVRRSGDPWSGRLSAARPLEAERDFTAVVELVDLEPSTVYEYRIRVDGLVVDEGASFQTLPPDGQPAAFRFFVGGDLIESLRPFSILERVLEQRPNFGILLGDLVYSDQPYPIDAKVDQYRAKYRTNWSDASFRRLTRQVPSFTMWDDHEIRDDFDEGGSERYWVARVAMEEYLTGGNPASSREGALYYQFRVGDVDFFVLDTRSHRGRNDSPSGDQKSMLGAEQKTLLKEWLLASRAPFKVIMSSVPMHDLGPPRRDAWAAFASERTELLELIRQRPITGVVVLSGDQHWSSLVRHNPYGVWEFNATPLAQFVQTSPLSFDPRLVLGYNNSTAFGVIDVDTRGFRPTMRFSIVDNLGQVRGQYTI